MAPKYVLHYFDARGRAEPIRWIFAYSNIDYEDHRFPRDQWPALKANTPFGQAPWLEIDGKPLPQSLAIARYLARQNGLVGKDDFEAAQVDALIDYIEDALKGAAGFRHEQDEKKKTAMKEKYANEVLPPFLVGFEKQLRANNNGEGFFVGGKPTWGDFVTVIFFDRLVMESPHLLDSHPLLKAHSQRVHDLKGIKEWLLKRPVTAT